MNPLSDEERSLMDETARRLVAARVAVPALMFLECLAPMNLVTATLLHGLTPILGVALPAARVERLARLLERRDAIPEFIRVLDDAEEARRRAASAPPAG
jgi:hypothetical protein